MFFLQLCSLEFEIRRASYYWLLDTLGLYKPFVWEFSRLNITNIVMSKRKVDGIIEGATLLVFWWFFISP